MKIAVDAMGGDYAPREVVMGALEASRQGMEIILVGDGEKILRELGKERSNRIEIVHSREAITMGEQPAMAVRRKRDSSAYSDENQHLFRFYSDSYSNFIRTVIPI